MLFTFVIYECKFTIGYFSLSFIVKLNLGRFFQMFSLTFFSDVFWGRFLCRFFRMEIFGWFFPVRILRFEFLGWNFSVGGSRTFWFSISFQVWRSAAAKSLVYWLPYLTGLGTPWLRSLPSSPAYSSRCVLAFDPVSWKSEGERGGWVEWDVEGEEGGGEAEKWGCVH